MWVYSHMSSSIWSVSAWLWAGKMLSTNDLFTFAAAVGAQRSILIIPSPLSTDCSLTFVCVWVHVPHFCLMTTRSTADGGWQTISDMHTLGGRQMDLADMQTEMWTSCVSVWILSQTTSHNYTCPCLSDYTAEIERCVFTTLRAVVWRCVTAGVWRWGWKCTL